MRKPIYLFVAVLAILGIVSPLLKAQGQTQPQDVPQSIPATEMTVVPTPVLPTAIPTANDASLFAQRGPAMANAQILELIDFINLSPEEEVVITRGSQNVDFGSLPTVSGFGPPCIPGAKFYQTGYSFNLSRAEGEHYHPGFDGACTDYKIAAAADGTVTYTGWVENDREVYGWAWSSGNTAIVKHNLDGLECFSVYGHLASFTVNSGDPVVAGQQLGVMGSTGNSTGPHLHLNFVCRVDGKLSFISPADNGALGTR